MDVDGVREMRHGCRWCGSHEANSSMEKTMMPELVGKAMRGRVAEAGPARVIPLHALYPPLHARGRPGSGDHAPLPSDAAAHAAWGRGAGKGPCRDGY